MPSTAPLITPSMHDLADNLRLVEHAMVLAIVRSGSGRRNEILDFQMLINRNLPLLNVMLGQSRPDLAQGGARFVKLVEDGAWGRNTAAALTLALVLTAHAPISLPPSQSSGVPAWYAQNRAAIDELVLAVSTATPPLSAQQTIPSSAAQQQTVQDALDQGAAAAKQAQATPVPQGAGLDAPIVAVQQTRAPLEVHTDFTEGPLSETEGRVVAARRGTQVPWIAVGAAAAALGGAMWWWTRRKRGA